MHEPPAVMLALTTEADQPRAEDLAQQLLDRGLVACVSLQQVTSFYRWQGQVERANEVQLLCKSTISALPALEAAVRELHSYDTPQWLVWPATASSDYAGWLTGAVAPTT